MTADRLLGKVIAGRYRVTARLGAGGMGAVYEAVQEPLGRPVALKVLKASFADDEIAVARFKKEAAIVARLNHPNIVTLHDFGETEDGLLYIVMELVRGVTLSRVVRGGGPMQWERTLPIIKDLVRALGAAHRAGVIHRDLKLDNLMLVPSASGREKHLPKILDFGVAKTIRSDGGPALTETDHSPGTPGYMSPELARGITDDPRSDLYALGVVWFELLTGRRPFLPKNAMDVFFQQMTQPPPTLREVAPAAEVPGPIDALIGRLLDRDPQRRPEDAGELLELIARISAEDSAPALPAPDRDLPQRAAAAAAAEVDSPPTAPTSTGAVFLPTMVGAPPATEPSARASPLVSRSSDEEPVSAPVATPAGPAVSSVPSAPSADAESSTSTVTEVSGPSMPSMPSMSAVATATAPVVTAPIARVRRERRWSSPTIAALLAASASAGIVWLVARPPPAPAAPAGAAAPAAPGQAALPDPAASVAVPSVAAAAAVPVPAVAPGVSVAPPGERRAKERVRSEPSVGPSHAEAVVAVAASGAPVPVVPEPPPSGAAPTVSTASAVAGSASGAEDVSALRERFALVGERVRERLLLPDDVPEYRALTAQVKADLDAGRAVDAKAALDALEKAVGGVRITDAFINQKLRRILASFPEGWPQNEADKAELRRLRADVHERFGARDLPAANLALNKLWLFSLKGRQRMVAPQR